MVAQSYRSVLGSCCCHPGAAVLWVRIPEGTVAPVAKGIVMDVLGHPWKALTLN